jgi:hypothetical protein
LITKLGTTGFVGKLMILDHVYDWVTVLKTADLKRMEKLIRH